MRMVVEENSILRRLTKNLTLLANSDDDSLLDVRA
jgi:hypothetical protein